eukprot:COSAG06_NODE_641_length_13489_cov_4.330769_10_plen_123_part_00
MHLAAPPLPDTLSESLRVVTQGSSKSLKADDSNSNEDDDDDEYNGNGVVQLSQDSMYEVVGADSSSDMKVSVVREPIEQNVIRSEYAGHTCIALYNTRHAQLPHSPSSASRLLQMLTCTEMV